MNNEPFHVLSQEYRYSSERKSILQTLRLAQLKNGVDGDGVAVPIDPSSTDNGLGGFSVPPLQLPGAPFISATIYNTYNQVFGSRCYGCVAYDQSITAQKQMGISIDSWSSTIMQVTFSPAEPGIYYIHVEAQTDQRDYSYQGPASDGACLCQIYTDGGPLAAQGNDAIFMNGPWDASMYIQSVMHSNAEVIKSVNGSIVCKGINLGDPAGTPAAHISCFAFKINTSP